MRKLGWPSWWWFQWASVGGDGAGPRSSPFDGAGGGGAGPRSSPFNGLPGGGGAGPRSSPFDGTGGGAGPRSSGGAWGGRDGVSTSTEKEKGAGSRRAGVKRVDVVVSRGGKNGASSSENEIACEEAGFGGDRASAACGRASD